MVEQLAVFALLCRCFDHKDPEDCLEHGEIRGLVALKGSMEEFPAVSCIFIVACRPEVTRLRAVLKLGRIEWMRPTYHTKKHIFPVGYSAVRAVELSAARGKPVQCLCEIGESADSFEPVFRYSSTSLRGHASRSLALVMLSLVSLSVCAVLSSLEQRKVQTLYEAD